MNGRSRIGSNTAFLAGKVLLASLFGLLQMKIFTGFLSLEGMGLLQAMRGLVSLLVALVLVGLPLLAVRFLPQLETRGERGRILRISGGLFLLLLIACALLGLVAWWTRGGLLGRIGANAGGETLLPQVFALAFGMALTEMAYGVYQGLRRMGPVAVVEVLGIALTTGHLFLLRDGLEPGVALGILAAYFYLRFVLLLALFPRQLPRQREDAVPLRIEGREVRSYWGISLFLRGIAPAYLDLDRYVVGLVGALDLVALFHVPAKLVWLCKSFLAAPALSLQTEVSRLYEERRESELPVRLQLFLRTQLVLTFWLAGSVFLLASPLILLTSTSAYLQALPLLALLLVTLPLGSLAAPMEFAFRGLNGLGTVLVGNLVWGLCYFGSLPWLLRSQGLVGLGMAQVLGATLQSAWILGAARRRGWLAGAGRRLPDSLAWGASPLPVALGVALLMPGARGLAPSALGAGLGLLLLVLGALWLLAGERVLGRSEKVWLLARLPMPALRRLLARLLRVPGETP